MLHRAAASDRGWQGTWAWWADLEVPAEAVLFCHPGGSPGAGVWVPGRHSMLRAGGTGKHWLVGVSQCAPHCLALCL